jgi:bacillithiol biosynthesis cysteine-adding enzyme BshC
MTAFEHLPADIFELSPIARAALTGRPHPPSLPGIVVPSDVRDIPRPPEHLQPDERVALSKTLERELSYLSPHVAVLDAARRVAEHGATLVLAGQQPGFLGGPLYDVWKALHAVRLARALEEEWGTPVVAAFWNHADDHDVAEVHHVEVLNANLDVTTVRLAGLSSGRTPFSRLTIDAEEQRLGSITENLRQLLGEDRVTDEVLASFLPRDGETLARSFTRLFTKLLGHLGLVVIEPDWIRPSLSRALAHVVGVGPAPLLDEGAEALRAAGHDVAIDPATAALVYRHVDDRRHALRSDPGGFRYDDEPGSRTPAELAAEIVQEPYEYSPGALLRPLCQDLALPVAAYVGGWGELAYHAELPPLRERAGVPVTPFVPRLACTLVEPDVAASLRKLSASVGDVLAAGGEYAGAGAGEPESEVAGDLRARGRRAAAELQELRGRLEDLDPGLARQLKRTGGQIGDLIDRLAKKVERVEANRRGGGRRHLRRVNHALVPRGKPQERVRGAFELCLRAGRDWIDAVLAAVEPFPTEHLVHFLPALAPRGEADSKEQGT